MIKFYFDLESDISEWKRGKYGWISQNSFIKPFLHLALESFMLRCDNECLFVIRESLNDNNQNTFENSFVEVGKEQFERTKEKIKEWPLHFMTIYINNEGNHKRITIHNGKWAVAPVFVVRNKKKMWGHWDPTELYSFLPEEPLDTQRTSHFLIGFANYYSRKTLFKNLYQITERSTLHYHTNGKDTSEFKIVYPPSITAPVKSRALKPGADVLGMYEEILSGSIKRWMNKQVQVSSEMSGGLDSTSVVAVISSLQDKPLYTYGTIVTGKIGELQLERRNEIATNFGVRDSYIYAKDHLPFSRDGSRFLQDYFVPWEECYYEAFDKMYDSGDKLMNQLMFTGLGGDELFFPHWDELGESEKQLYHKEYSIDRNEIPAYIKKQTVAHYYDSLECLDKAPRSIIPTSSLESAGYGDARLLRSGIWPAHPFCTPELIWFCRSLPSTWRKNRKLQRSFLASKGCSRQVTHPRVSETFSDIMTKCLTSSSYNLMNEMLSDSYLAKLGFIDNNEYLKIYKQCCKYKNGKQYYPGFYAVLILELTLRSIERKKENPSTFYS